MLVQVSWSAHLVQADKEIRTCPASAREALDGHWCVHACGVVSCFVSICITTFPSQCLRLICDPPQIPVLKLQHPVPYDGTLFGNRIIALR